MDEKILKKFLENIGDLTPIQFKDFVKAYATKNRLPEKAVWESAVYGIAEQHLIKAGVIQADETVLYESQKGSKKGLVIKTI